MAHLHRLVQESLNALGQPGFRRTFIRFLALQRYDLTPHRRLFDTIDVDDRIQDGKVTIGGNPISGEDLATRFVDFLSGAARQWELAQLAEEFFRAFVHSAEITLHIDLLRGNNAHHAIEAVFKAFGVALSMASELSNPGGDIPSTKGKL